MKPIVHTFSLDIIVPEDLVRRQAVWRIKTSVVVDDPRQRNNILFQGVMCDELRQIYAEHVNETNVHTDGKYTFVHESLPSVHQNDKGKWFVFNYESNIQR
jgi:hypothetical protein